MKRILLIWLLVFCASISDAQIKTQREYDYIGNEVNSAGLRVVEFQQRFGCIDKDGKEVVPIIYSKVLINKDADYIVVGNADYESKIYNWGLLSEDGKYEIVPPVYSYIPIITSLFKRHNCTIVITQRGHYGVINRHGEIIVPMIYEQLYWIDEYNGYLAACLNGQWGVVNIKGVEIIPFNYLKLDGQGGIMISVNSSKQVGLIDTNNNVLIPYGKYDDLKYFNGKTIWAQKGNAYALINTMDEIIIPFKKYKNDGISSSSIKKEMYVGIYSYKYYGFKESSISMHHYWSVKRYKRYDKKLRNGWYDNNGFFTYKYIDDNGKEYDDEELALISNEIIRKDEIVINKSLATISWLSSFDVMLQKVYELKIGVKSDSKIENVSVSVNGVLDRGIKTVETNDYDLTINKTITLIEGENTIKVSVAGTTQEEKTIVYRPQGGELPSIEWLDFVATANKKEYQMRLGIKSKSKVEEVNVTVNGALTRGIKTVAADGYDLTVDRTLSLSEGLNRIVVSVRNGDGISTSEKVITYQGNNPTPVFNDKRIAFVIGNSHYSNSEMNLANPENDAKDVAEKLKGLGFEVVLKLDATKENMERELSAFGEKAKDYDVALFYYAGHGIQSKGVNYLIPTNIDDLAENNLKWKCVNIEQVLDVMEDSQCKLKVVVLDACRNDPVSRKWHRSTATRGLSIMSSPIGTIIAYSTAPGMTAQDGTGRNSPYTEAFLNTLDQPNLDISNFFQEVMAHVTKKTHQSQNPWWSSSYTGKFYFNRQ